MSHAILAVSFGTSFLETREKNILAVEQELAAAFPSSKLYAAYTSGMVRRALEKKGVSVPDVSQAMSQMLVDGVKTLTVAPTLLLLGEEYDRLCAAVEKRRSDFESVTIAKPLLASQEDMVLVLKSVVEANPVEPGEAMVCMGHGTRQFTNTVYSALDYLAKASDLPHVFIGTVEAFPDLETVLAAVKRAGYEKVLLTPLMLVAGDHAINDMASEDEDSWRTAFENAGFSVRCAVRGLGELPEIRSLYRAHAEAAR